MCPSGTNKKGDHIELVVFADDATKIQRIYDNLGLDYVKAEAGEATLEKAAEQEQQAPQPLPPAEQKPSRWKMAQWNSRWAVLRMTSISVLPGRVKLEILPLAGNREFRDPAAEKSPSEPSSPSKNSSPGLTSRDDQPEQKPSVKKELQEIKQGQVKKKKKKKAKQQDRQHPTPGHSVKKEKTERQVMQYRLIQFNRKETGTAAGTAQAVQRKNTPP